MRKLIYGINLSLDGCCDHAKFGGGEDVHNYFTHLLRTADTLVYGRKTYELMVPFWPSIAKDNSGDNRAMNDFAQAFSDIKNLVVFSRSLKNPENSNTSVYRDHLQEEIIKLKSEHGKNILTGGVDIPSQLIQAGLVDEFHIIVHPTIVGEGRRLFDDLVLPSQTLLQLVESKTFPSGAVLCRYMKI